VVLAAFCGFGGDLWHFRPSFFQYFLRVGWFSQLFVDLEVIFGFFGQVFSVISLG
jgi:hypothetical protein